MRMWMVSPKLLCNKHLIGEHGEIHKHRHTFIKKHSIKGRLHPFVAIEPKNMLKRHDDLVREMVRRNFNHNSPFIMPNLDHLTKEDLNAKVDLDYNLKDLADRCSNCAKRIRNEKDI